MNEQVIQGLRTNPQVQAKVQQAVANLQEKGITVEQVDKILQLLAFVLKNPTSYPKVRDEAIKSGVLSSSQLPERFDSKSIVGMVIIIQMIKEAMAQQSPQGFAKGGLASIAAKGRHGDTILAHINPVEADILRSMGGKGTKNPETGLPEFGFFGFIGDAISSVGDAIGSVWDSAKDVISTAAPVVLSLVAPGLGTAVGSALGLGGAAASIIGSAALGAGVSGLTGGNAAQGALLGGLGGGLGAVAGNAINDVTGLGKGASNILGSGLIGGAFGAATGKGFGQGAGMGLMGGTVGQLAGLAGSGSAIGTGVGSAGQSIGNALTAGGDAKSALAAGVLSGLYSGMKFKPSEAVISNATNTATNTNNSSQTGSFGANTAAPGSTTGTSGGVLGTGISPTAAIMGGLSLVNSLSGAPKEVLPEISKLSASQQEYFNRPSVTWNWNQLQNDANASNQSLSQYMSSNWNRILSGTYNNPVVSKARGGALAMYAQGAGTGRSDEIDAKLSDGEYVIDAETVAMLGDGSNKAGAQKLDQMRAEIRKQKGRMLAKGKISPNAKSPLNYIKGIA